MARGAVFPQVIDSPGPVPAAAPESEEPHWTIRYGEVGHAYESIMGLELRGSASVRTVNPYIRLPHPLQTFVRSRETLVKSGGSRKISLPISYGAAARLRDTKEKCHEINHQGTRQTVAYRAHAG